MKKFTAQRINEILLLYRNGLSLSKISSKLGIGKTSIYYHVRKRFGKKLRDVVVNESLREELGEIIGAFAGDGNLSFYRKLYHYKITFYLSNYEDDYAKRLVKLILLVFNKKPYIWNSKKSNCILVSVYGKKICDTIKRFLTWENDKTFSVRLKDMNSLDKPFLIGFLNGLVNTDGAVNIPKKRVMFATISKELRQQASKILNGFNIPHCNYIVKGKNNKRDLYCFEIGSKNGVLMYKDLIGITNSYKMKQLDRIKWCDRRESNPRFELSPNIGKLVSCR